MLDHTAVRDCQLWYWRSKLRCTGEEIMLAYVAPRVRVDIKPNPELIRLVGNLYERGGGVITEPDW